MWRGNRAGAIGLAGLLAVNAAVSGAPRVLHHGTSADPPSLDPNIAAGSLAAPILGDMFASLLVRDAESRPAPGSAESWSVSEDGRTYTFRLRPDLRWSDGQPLTAEDFVWSFRRLMTPATGSQLAGAFFVIENGRKVFLNQSPPETLGVSAPDLRTVVIRLEHPAPYFIQFIANLQAVPVPRHVIEKYGTDWTRAGNMVSNGAYMLAERVPQSYVKLVRNPNFFAADTVKIDEVYWHPTQDLATSLRRFRSGELDIVLNFPPDEIDWIRKNIPESLRIGPTLATYFMVINMRKPPWNDARVRRALSLAIDRETITERLLRTGVKPAWSFASPEFSGYGGIRNADQDMTLMARQAEARRLLADAGFGPAKPLVVPLIYDTQEENRKIMVAVAAMWQAIGVRTELTNVEFSLLNRRVRTKDFDVARWTYFASFDDAYSFLQLLLVPNPNNWPGYANPRYDQLLEQSNGITDPAQRMAVLREAEELMIADYPVIPIYFYVGRRLVSPAVQGWIDTPRGQTPSRYLSLRD
jgi:oligopeptide transport system substrate-binding protein